jgi:signal transduction histidine kinase
MASPSTSDTDDATDASRLRADNLQLVGEVDRLRARNAEIEAALAAQAIDLDRLAAAVDAARRDGALALDQLNLILSMGPALPLDQLAARLAEVRHQVSALIAHVDQRSLDLRPTLLDDMGLRTALIWYLERYTEQTGIAVIFQDSGLDRPLAPAVDLTAYRIVQEALTNVARHAGVTEVTVRAWVLNGRLLIQIEDVGRGFDVAPSLRSHGLIGLAEMRERARMVGGDLSIESQPGGGTRLRADLPAGGDGQAARRPA